MMFKVGRNKLATVSLVSVLIVGTIVGTLILRNDKPSGAATASCYGQPATHTSVYPKSVTPGQTFKITNITGAANTNIATVNSVTVTYTVAYATPTTITQSWTGGPVHGDYSSSYPDVTLKANGKAGDVITMTTKSISAQVSIAGVNQTLVCSAENGQLTANNAGESLIVASIKIVAPTATSSPTSSNTKTAGGSTSTNKKLSPAKKSATGTAAQSVDTNQAVTGQTVTITVVDYKGKPVKDANVIVDSIPAVKTDSAGKASLNDVDAGQHNLSVTANGRTITRTFQATDQAGTVLGISVQLPAPSHKLRNIIIGGAVGLMALLAMIITLISIKRHKRVTPIQSNNVEPSMPSEPTSPMGSVAEPTVVQPTDPNVRPKPPEHIPMEPPQLNNDKK